MYRRYYKWPEHVKLAVIKYIRDRTNTVTVRRFGQEHDYLSGILANLIGTVIDDGTYYISINTVRTSSSGPNSAESIYGADFSMIIEIHWEDDFVIKGIIGQSKKGYVTDLSKRDKQQLKNQLKKMRQLTSAPKIVELPTDNTETIYVLSGKQYLRDNPNIERLSLSSYFIRQILTCIEGDTNPEFIQKVSEGTFGLKVNAGYLYDGEYLTPDAYTDIIK